ncbi:MAG: adenosine kinase [Bdellovibrionales bacterium]
MSKMNVYGIGNALVDYEFKVSDEQLSELKIDKGLMTLVDEPRQHQLLESLHQGTPTRACGGSAANTVIAVSQLGGSSFYSCKVASDETGDFYLSDLKSNGVESSLDHVKRESGVTGKCFVMVTPDAERSMETFLGITETLSENELVTESIKNSDYLYMEGYVVTSPTGKAAAVKARHLAEESGVKTAITFSDPNMVEFFKDGLKEMIGNKVDLLFCNEAEALKYAETESLDEAIAKIKEVAKSFTITLGKKGSMVFDGNEEVYVDGFPAEAVDSNGAGDLYAGTFLYGITNGKSFSESARLANYASSLLVQQFGPRLNAENLEKLNSFKS